jgi:hypothetical protein
MELHHSITEIKITCDSTPAVKIQAQMYVPSCLGYALATHNGERKLKQFGSADEVGKKDSKKKAKTVLVTICQMNIQTLGRNSQSICIGTSVYKIENLIHATLHTIVILSVLY